MSDLHGADSKRFADAWRAASGRLESLRRRELACVVLADHIRSFDDAFESALLNREPSATSGLVAQQAVFRKLRDDGSAETGS